MRIRATRWQICPAGCALVFWRGTVSFRSSLEVVDQAITSTTELGPRSFPLSGLKELEPDWQDLVMDIVTQPPVSQILKVSVYTPSLTETMLIALVERAPLLLAAA